MSGSTFAPASYLTSAPGASAPTTTALLILNQPIASVTVLARIWPRATYRVCADGGANRLYDILQYDRYESTHTPPFLPSAIHGDLDSLDPKVRRFFETFNVPVTEDPDQYSTDFNKSIALIRANVPDLTDILVIGSIAGRLDQGVRLLRELGHEHVQHPETRMWLFSEASISFVLPKGASTIDTPGIVTVKDDEEVALTRNIGILPVFGPAVITTTGFEWDVTDWPSDMLGNVSSSNHVVANSVQVVTDNMVLFTIEQREGL